MACATALLIPQCIDCSKGLQLATFENPAKESTTKTCEDNQSNLPPVLEFSNPFCEGRDLSDSG
jgi:hypothetical protein